MIKQLQLNRRGEGPVRDYSFKLNDKVVTVSRFYLILIVKCLYQVRLRKPKNQNMQHNQSAAESALPPFTSLGKGGGSLIPG